jgi:isopenicillin-N N-acyltransferase-like protein
VRAFSTAAVQPFARGAELGRANAVAVRETLDSYRGLWAVFGVGAQDVRAVGAAVLTPVRAFAPHLWEEMAGLAAGSGLSLDEVGALNARTELLALGGWGPSECTTSLFLPADGGSAHTVQTWDWHDAQAGHWFVWSLRHPDGTAVHTLTEYGIVGKIGVSSRGLSVHFNALRHRDDTGTGGVPVHVVARRILDEAGTVEQAVAIAAQAQVTASSSVTVTGRSGDSWATAMVELHPGGPTVVTGAGEYAAHTNHFLGLPEREQVHRPGTTTHQRLAHVSAESAARRPRDRDAMVRVLADHTLGPRGVCAHVEPETPPGERTATLAVAHTEPGRAALSVHAGSACDAVEQGAWFTP